MSGKGRIYWDSCIFIAHLGNETRQNPSDMYGVNELVSMFDMGQIDLVTSVITITEVLESSMGKSEYEKFRLLFSRKNCHLVEVNRGIAEISHEIRNYYYQPGTPTLSTPDCLHLATAIWFDCCTFYTFDGESGKSGLLTLKAPIAGKYDLPIKIPAPSSPPQLSFNIPNI
ncbi:MAG: PIN domain-containing protein [Anaerolineaceae bacterium]|jgi:predicted nucleic acid-binding protein